MAPELLCVYNMASKPTCSTEEWRMVCACADEAGGRRLASGHTGAYRAYIGTHIHTHCHAAQAGAGSSRTIVPSTKICRVPTRLGLEGNLFPVKSERMGVLLVARVRACPE
eukprot:scaffold25864_cov140-Isochrysis_galbana.AAC.4